MNHFVETPIARSPPLSLERLCGSIELGAQSKLAYSLRHDDFDDLNDLNRWNGLNQQI